MTRRRSTGLLLLTSLAAGALRPSLPRAQDVEKKYQPQTPAFVKPGAAVSEEVPVAPPNFGPGMSTPPLGSGKLDPYGPRSKGPDDLRMEKEMAEGGEGGPDPGTPAEPLPPSGGGAAGDDEPLKPFTKQDAQINLPTVVQTYFAENAHDDVFPLRDGKTKQVWKLQLERVTKIRPLGGSKYVGCAEMVTADNAHKLDVDFTVDFSSDRWRVKQVRIHIVDGKKRFTYRRR